VSDSEAPVISGAEEASVACGDFPGEALAAAVDNCGEVSLTFEDAAFAGGCVQPFGMFVRTYTATDACGNSSTFEQIITLTDETAPEVSIQCPQSATVVLGAACDVNLSPAVTGEASATVSDNCDAEPMLVITHSDGAAQAGCGGSYSFERTFIATATDACGNSTSQSCVQLITVIDQGAPTIVGEPFVSIACDVFDAEVAYAEASDACSSVELSFTTLPFAGGCVTPFTYFTRIYTATDACGNTAEFEQVVMLIDTVAPVFTFVPADASIACDAVLPTDPATAADNCDAAVEVTYSDVYLQGSSALEYSVVRTFVATDGCGNTATATQTFTIEDTVAPMVLSSNDSVELTTTDLAQEGLAALVDSYQPYAVDNCDPGNVNAVFPGPGALDYTYTVDSVQGTCPGAFVYVITYSFSDQAGNAVSAVTEFVFADTEAPSFEVPSLENVVVECDAVPAVLALAASDTFGPATVNVSETVIPTGCASEYTLQRTYTATDGCGNSATLSHLIDVVDTTGPEVVTSCTYENGQIIELCFDDPQGNFDLPEPCNVTFADACGGPVTVTYEETILGDGIATAPGVLNYCEPTDPAPLASGSCSNTAPHALRLINFPGGQFYLAQEGTVTQLADGRWILTQTVVHASNPNAGWNISMTYGPGMNWTQWLAQPGPQGYKFDCPILVDDHLNWTYRLLQSGTLTGWGTFAGSQFNLFHQPANGYFGMQLGHGASNLNNNFGYVGWFFMVGQHQGVSYSGTGDIFGDLNCAQPVSVERVYTATDCAGNESQFSYTLLFSTENCDTPPIAPGMGNSTSGSNGLVPSDGEAHAGGQGTFRSAEVLPNPTQDATALRLVLDEEERVRVDVVSLTGATLLGEVFEGALTEGMQHSIPLNVSGLAAGMYQVRVQSATRQSVVRLLIVD
jgi:hypothetical protein